MALGAEAQAAWVQQAGTSHTPPPAFPRMLQWSQCQKPRAIWNRSWIAARDPARDKAQHFNRGRALHQRLLLCPTCPQRGQLTSSHKNLRRAGNAPGARNGAFGVLGEHESCPAWPWQAPGSPARIHPQQAAPSFPKIGWRSPTWKRPWELSVLQALPLQDGAPRAAGVGVMGMTRVGRGSPCLLGTITGETVLPPAFSSSSASQDTIPCVPLRRGPGKQRGSWARRRGRTGARIR